MGADFRSREYLPRSGHIKSKGIFREGNEAYYIEVIDSGKESLEVKLRGDERIEVEVDNRPILHDSGVNESLALSTETALVPRNDEELEAYARYALEHGEEFAYDGPDPYDLLEEEDLL